MASPTWKNSCGTFIAKWGGEWTEKANCHCSTLESLEPILIHCQSDWRLPLWQHCKMYLKTAICTSSLEFKYPTFNDILGIRLYPQTNDNLNRQTLYKLIVSETAFVIWKLRCANHIHNEVIMLQHALNTLDKAVLKQATSIFEISKLKEYQEPQKKESYEHMVNMWNGLIDRTSTVPQLVLMDHG